MGVVAGVESLANTWKLPESEDSRVERCFVLLLGE